MNDIMKRLSVLRDNDIIRDIDLEICRFLQDQHPKIAEGVLLGGCLASYHYRQGNVCMLLADHAGQLLFEETDLEFELTVPGLDSWRRQLTESPAVGGPGSFTPLILDKDDRLYLHKLWHYENSLAEELLTRSKQQYDNINISLLRDGLGRLFRASAQQPDLQQVAAVTALRKKLSIISGGPGTGKTSTVVRVLALLIEQYAESNQPLSVALAAPTGKAAARLKDSIASAKEELAVSDEIRAAIPDEARTIHQLLGARRHTASFKHNSENPLPYDVIIVDEASMIDQALMSKLLGALLEDCRLILLGDKDQLASVEAGSVLGDICSMSENSFSPAHANWLNKLSLEISEEQILQSSYPLTDNITLLTKSYRFDENSGIARLAQEINMGDDERALEVLESEDFTDVALVNLDSPSTLKTVLREQLTGYFREILQSDSQDKALDLFNRFRLLAAHRRGPWGVEYLNKLVEKLLREEGLIPKYRQWYPGKPVIISVNDYSLRLHNGDTGLCLPDERGDLQVYFRKEGALRAIAPGRLPDHDTAFVLTVHKSQGSEFDKVMLVLPNAPSKVLSRELIYTAITRSRRSISILGNHDVLGNAITEKVHRYSGLRDRLW